jgi:hypothetical protein
MWASVVTRGLLGDKKEATNLQHDGLTIAVQTIVSTEKICQTLNFRARPRVDYLYTQADRGDTSKNPITVPSHWIRAVQFPFLGVVGRRRNICLFCARWARDVICSSLRSNLKLYPFRAQRIVDTFVEVVWHIQTVERELGTR